MWEVLYFLTFLTMRSLNKTMLLGHLAANPEIKKTESGITMAVFPIATNRDWRSSDGTKKEAVDYHRVIAWRKMADICVQHLVKGSPVFIEGRIQNSSYDGKDGKKHYSTEIVLDKLYILVYKKQKDSVEVGVADVSEEREQEQK